MREQMRNQDRTMANIESHPEGFNALRRMYENFQEPLMDAATGQGSTQQDPLAALLGGAAGSANQPAGMHSQRLPWQWPSLAEHTSVLTWAGSPIFRPALPRANCL